MSMYRCNHCGWDAGHALYCPNAEWPTQSMLNAGMRGKDVELPPDLRVIYDRITTLPAQEKQDYNLVLNYCCDPTHHKDVCIENCQSANFLAGHLITLIMECRARGYIDEKGFIVDGIL